MPSYLTFAATQVDRNRNLSRNLRPYTVAGVYSSPPVSQIVVETIGRLPVRNVVDSPDSLIADDPFADLLYPLNLYGPDGGYNKNIGIRWLTNTRSGAGPYDYSDAKLPRLSQPIQEDIPTLNKYAPENVIQLYTIDEAQIVPTFVPYSDPLSFIPSSYSPYQLLLQNDPQGTNGRLTQDSFLAQLGAKSLRKDFEARIAQQIYKNSLGRVNLLNAVSDPIDAVQILQGKRPLIERDWVITRPQNFVFKAADFIARLGGVYFPGSTIPGDYFLQPQNGLSLFGQISTAFNGGRDPRSTFLGGLFGRYLNTPSPSQLFLNNTGGGQRSQLFFNLNFNRFSPDYDRSLAGEISDFARRTVRDLLNLQSRGGYYVGSRELQPGQVLSPPGEVPVTPWGQETSSQVYGLSETAKLYEDVGLKIATNGRAFSDGGGLTGGLVWTSPKYNNPGFKAKVGGDQGPADDEFNLVKSQIQETDSQQFEFRQSSILDNTQRILDSTPNGAKRLSHAGNAINQLSKVFNDGYKELTKGSRVVGYTNSTKRVYNPTNVYCRVFTKDTPYFTFNDLQKTDGNIRKFTYSVLDNTYNLNIAPLKNPGSTNIIDGKVKKYMFSLENLAWRTSNRPGVTYSDLPECEKGPNGGRIMWFPPYDLSFSETVSPSFKSQDFLGRPEPVYTYTSTKRTGSLSWKIIVDHPSILNIIVNKELANESNAQRVNSIVDSFMAGCLKYDIYELAKRWNTIPQNLLFTLQQTITENRTNQDLIREVRQEINGTDVNSSVVATSDISVPDLKRFEAFSFYFDNDIPDPKTEQVTTNTNWVNLYNTYLGQQSNYQSRAATPDQKTQIQQFFSEVIQYNFTKSEELFKEIKTYFDTFKPIPGAATQPKVTITLVGSASAPAKQSYNKKLSARRIESVKNYLKTTALSEYLDKTLFLVDGTAAGEQTTVSPVTPNGVKTIFNCNDDDTNKVEYDKIYSPNAMACRRVAISNVDYTKPEPNKTQSDIRGRVINVNQTVGYKQPPPVPPTISTTQKIREGISKKILRHLLSECDYFELVKQSNPMFYDSMKEKIKYFNPAFHSITPEGLNSRLTFLQQCARPGDTIPVIGIDGKPQYNNATNTSFGAPPVLILRIGDFFHTKIIPGQIQIQYENNLLDLNPEGIGVQPMMAKVTMSFDIVGGEGLKNPIDRLQNALSFNYYANTEMYDERAEWTDDSFKSIDANLVKDILAETTPVTINDVNNNIPNPGGVTIGVIGEKNTTSSGESGTILYQNIMDSLHDQGQKYISTIYGKTEQVVKDFNLPIFRLFSSKRDYVDGKTREFTTPNSLQIFGKSKNFETSVIGLRDQCIDDIKKVTSASDGGFQFIARLYDRNIPKSEIKNIKNNLIKEVERASQDIITSLSQTNQEIVIEEQSLVGIFAKLDFVDTKSDGYIKDNQSAVIYDLSATTQVQTGSSFTDTYQEFVGDYTSATNILYSYYNLIKDKKFIVDSFDTNNIELSGDGGGFIFNNPQSTNAEKRFYTIMSRIILNPNTFQTFKTNTLGSGAQTPYDGITTSNIFDLYFNPTKKDYDDEHKAELKYFDDNFKSQMNTYQPWSPYNKGKTRKFDFISTSGTTTQVTRIKNIYKDGNSNDEPNTFNGKTKFK